MCILALVGVLSSVGLQIVTFEWLVGWKQIKSNWFIGYQRSFEKKLSKNSRSPRDWLACQNLLQLLRSLNPLLVFRCRSPSYAYGFYLGSLLYLILDDQLTMKNGMHMALIFVLCYSLYKLIISEYLINDFALSPHIFLCSLFKIYRLFFALW